MITSAASNVSREPIQIGRACRHVYTMKRTTFYDVGNIHTVPWSPTIVVHTPIIKELMTWHYYTIFSAASLLDR